MNNAIELFIPDLMRLCGIDICTTFQSGFREQNEFACGAIVGMPVGGIKGEGHRD